MEEKPAYKDLCDPNALMAAAKMCTKRVMWKYSTQAYYLDRLERVRITMKRLKAHDRMSDGFVQFRISERGKERDIRSIHINERVIHRAENDLVLVPTLRPRLIYDNAASLKLRGTHFAMRRLKVHLWRYYRKHGSNDGYILVCDIRKYFDTVDHDVVFEDYSKIFGYDPDLVDLTMDFVDAFGEKSLGLGSQVSQMTAVHYLNDIDHFALEQLKVEGYGRNMDDFYMIHESKEYLQECLDRLRKKCAEKGLELNESKTKIVKLSHEFKFLKAMTHLTSTGRVVMRPGHDTIVRERRKLKALRRKLDKGEITYFDVKQSYNAWMGHMKHFDAYRTTCNMTKLFRELFRKEIIKEKKGAYKNARGNYKRFRGEFKHYEFPERVDPAQRRHFARRGPERNNLRVGDGRQ